MTGSFSGGFVRYITNRFITADYMQEFILLKNDEERFLHSLNVVIKNSAVILDSKTKHKNSQHSVRFREDGNKSFKNGEYYQALREYTKSIMYAVDTSQELSLAYANRSAALFELEKYTECMEDVDRALNLNYPDRLKFKLYKRKGLCLRRLGQPGAIFIFKEALVWLNKMNLSQAEMKETETEMNEFITIPQADSRLPANVKQWSLPVIVTPNSEAPSASSALAIKYSEKYGRHIVATRKIEPGEVLIVEKPYCLRLAAAHIYTHCSKCLQVSWNMIPCKFCVNAAYCSEKCSKKAWDECHEVECAVAGSLLNFELNHVYWISIRITIMALRNRANLEALKTELANVDRNEDLRTKGYDNDGKFSSKQYRSACSLASDIEKCTIDELSCRCLWVAIIACLVARESQLFGKKLNLDTLMTNQDVIFAGKLLLRHISIVGINLYRFGSPRLTFGCHGAALMAVCSLLNHSCDANTIRQWHVNSMMVVYACYPINEGEQIFTNYATPFYSTSKSDRQRCLEHWHFKCECAPCTEDWPQLHDLPSFAVQPLTQNNRRMILEVLQKMQKIIFSESLTLKSNFVDQPNTLSVFLEMIQILFRLTQRPSIDLSLAIEGLIRYYSRVEKIFSYEPVDSCNM